MWRKLPDFRGGEESVESCHVSGCHGFFGLEKFTEVAGEVPGSAGNSGKSRNEGVIQRSRRQTRSGECLTPLELTPWLLKEPSPQMTIEV